MSGLRGKVDASYLATCVPGIHGGPLLVINGVM